jgi:hypothetical protein
MAVCDGCLFGTSRLHTSSAFKVETKLSVLPGPPTQGLAGYPEFLDHLEDRLA